MSILGAIIGLGAAAVSAIAGHSSQTSANKTNLKINQMNNEFNACEAQKQRDYNTQMWEENNRYNSPENQVSRLREAGLNPSLALGQVASGQVSNGPASGGAASSSGAAQMKGYDYSQLGGHFIQAIQNMNEAKLLDANAAKANAETDSLNIDNENRRMLRLAEINQVLANTKDKETENKLKEVQYKYADDLLGEGYKNEVRRGKLIEAETRESIARGVMQELQNENYPLAFKLQCGEMAATIAEKAANENLSRKKAQSEVESQLESMARQHGIRLDNQQKMRIMDAVVEKAIQETMSPVGRKGAQPMDWTGKRKYGEYYSK